MRILFQDVSRQTADQTGDFSIFCLRNICIHIFALLLAIPPLVSAGIVINEIMFHPTSGGVENPLEEFIELYNADPVVPVDLTGWQIDRGIDFTFPAVTLDPGSYLVIAADITTFFNRHPASAATVVGGWSGKLSNAGERIRLVDTLGVEADSVKYADEGEWAERVRVVLGGENGWDWQSDADGTGVSLELIQPGLPNNRGQNWSSSTLQGGTPGLVNTVSSTNLPPMIRKVKHEPAIPRFADPVTITARLEDEISHPSAQVHWRISAASPGAFNLAAMSEGDPGDFSVVLPPQAENSVIEFYISAQDGVHTRTWPAPTDQGQVANAYYLVDSTPDPPGTAVYRAVMSVADKGQYDTINRQSDALLNVTFIVHEGSGDAIRYQGGMRIRGNGSRGFNPPPLRINLAGDDPWKGQSSLNLNSRYSWLQFIGMHFMNLSGVAAPDAKRVQFYINGIDAARNDGTMRGSYVHIEPIGSEYLADKFPNDDAGNLYKKRSAAGDRDEKCWGVHYGTTVAYSTAEWYVADRWSKLTNSGENDWSDLQAFVETMHQASGTSYDDQVSAVIDLEQWIKWFAGMVLLNSYETNLSNGIDDDYCMYRGFSSGRFKLIPHDLDTIFGEGDTSSNPNDTIFPSLVSSIPRPVEDGRFPQLVTFFEHPEIRRQFFAAVRALLENAFSKATFDAHLQNHLGDWVTQEDLDAVISYMDQRRTFLSTIVNAPLSVSHSLPVVGGFPRATTASVDLSGSLDLTSTDTVLVNGQAALLDAVDGAWSLAGVGLFPGINRVTVMALDAEGEVLDEQWIEIWYEDGTTSALTGPITANTTLAPGDGPYRISGELVIAPGATLTIQAGTSLYFDQGALITVNGVLKSQGSAYARVYCGPVPNAALVPDPAGNGGLPDGPPKWGGIQFVDSLSSANLMSHTDVHHAQDENGSVGIHRSELVLHQMSFSGTHLRMVYADSSSLGILESVFPDMFGPGENAEALGLDDISEHITSEGAFPATGFFIIQGNRFGTNKGHNDVIDVDSGRRPGPILQVLDNVFTGVGDDELNLGGDVYVSGNLFMHVDKDNQNSDEGYASAISTGDAGSNTLIVATRNVFWDVDHAIDLKAGATTIFENNTIVQVHPDFTDPFGNPNLASAINLFVDEPGAQAGNGAYVGNNIFVDCPRIFGNVDLPGGVETVVELEHNLMAQSLAEALISTRIGTGLTLDPQTLIGHPHFIDEALGPFALLPGSPAAGAGLAGQDLGAAIAEGIYITGEPPEITPLNSASLSIGGPGIFSYVYRVNSGPWSDELAIGNGFDPVGGTTRTAEIELVGLAPGTYKVQVRGRDFAGRQQSGLTESRLWTVDPSFTQLRINEALASNTAAFEHAGSYPDLIELYNGGANPVDLSGMQLSDDSAQPGKFVFAPGSSIAGGEYLVLYADSETALPGTHLGFGLDDDGEGVFLHDAVAKGGALLDTVSFGMQIPDFSIGRTGSGGATWALTRPTPGAPNIAQPFGDPYGLRINEWLAAAEVRLEDDFIELYNPDSLPVYLGGLTLTDEPQADPGRHVIAPLSFIAGSGFAVFHAVGEADPTDARALSFKLAALHEWIALNDENLYPIDLVNFQSEVTDISAGRVPDGGLAIDELLLPTPGTENTTPTVETVVTTLVELPAIWAYEQSNVDLGTAWIAPSYDDLSWPRGPALLYRETGALNGPAGTEINLNPPTTHYFRHAFDFSGDINVAQWEYDLFADDGAVI
ncbi:MAG: lamin tail domain-containing protein, partial [Verrucomicrobiota bacterium]